MKKVLIVFIAMLVFSVAAFAGPLIGIQVAPAINATAGLTVGWTFGYASIEGSKTNFNTWDGTWSLAGLWTPEHNDFTYRIGPKITWYWPLSGLLQYKGLSIVVGAARTFGAFQIFGELDFESTGALKIKPLLGVNILFDGFFPQDVQTE